MKTSTMVGLFAGGAILVLTAAPRAASGAIAYPYSGQVPAAPGPGGNLNPFNWLSQLGQPAQQPTGYLPNYSGGGYLPAGYADTQYAMPSSPAYVPSGYDDATFYGGEDALVGYTGYGTDGTYLINGAPDPSQAYWV